MLILSLHNIFDDKIGSWALADIPAQNPEVIWEYWNGTGWVTLQLTQNSLANFLTSAAASNKVVSFRCPNDITETAVNGQQNVWIRARITGGSYGTFLVVSNKTIEPNFKFPKVNSLALSYQTGFKPTEQCITYNNLNYQDHTQDAQTTGTVFQPFLPPEEDKPTFYLGFDKPLVSGPIGIFFPLIKQEYLEETKPRLQWQYWNGNVWIQLDVLDDTDNLTRSGLLQLIGPADFLAREKFGKVLFWIRAVDVENRFQPPPLPTILALPQIHTILRLASFPGLLPLRLSRLLRNVQRSGFATKSYDLTAHGIASKMPSGSFTGDFYTGTSTSSDPEKPCPELLQVFHPKFSVPAALGQFPPPRFCKAFFQHDLGDSRGDRSR